MRAFLIVTLAALMATASTAARAASEAAFLAKVQCASDLLDASLEAAYARSIPIPAASFGVRYGFDAETGTFTRQAALVGQVYLERADTLGRHGLNVSLVYQRAELDRLGGQDAGHFSGGLPIRPFPQLAVALQLGPSQFDIVAHEVVPTISFGLTDQLDVSLTMPLVYGDLRSVVRVAALGINSAGETIRLRDTTPFSSHRWEFGDLLLRGKYRVGDVGPVAVAGSLGVSFPSGPNGTGAYTVTPQIVVTSHTWTAARWARFQAHLNAGADLDSDDVGGSAPRWGVGLDWGVGDSLVFAASVLGRHPLRRLAPAGALDLPRCNTSLLTCARTAPPLRQQTIFGVDPGRPDYYDLGLGGRVSLWHDQVIGFASVLLPLNDAGARLQPVPLVGIEATF